MTRGAEERKAKSEEDIAEKLKKLKELFDAGVINEQVYQVPSQDVL